MRIIYIFKILIVIFSYLPTKTGQLHSRREAENLNPPLCRFEKPNFTRNWPAENLEQIQRRRDVGGDAWRSLLPSNFSLSSVSEPFRERKWRENLLVPSQHVARRRSSVTGFITATKHGEPTVGPTTIPGPPSTTLHSPLSV